MERLRTLRSAPPPDADVAKPEDSLTEPIVETRIDVAAVRIRSPWAGELWLARDREVADDLACEHTELPVLLFSELPRLKGMSRKAIIAMLNTRAVFSGAVWVQ